MVLSYHILLKMSNKVLKFSLFLVIIQPSAFPHPIS